MSTRDPREALNAARAAFAAGDAPAALSAAEAALALAPGDVDALALAVNAALRADAPERAIPHLERLRVLFPDNAQFRRMLSMALNNRGARQLRAGEVTIAAASFVAALELWPDNSEALFNQARIALDARRYAHALPYLRRLRELRPDDAQVALELAESELALDHESEDPRLLQQLQLAARHVAIDGLRVAMAFSDAGAADAALAEVRRIDDMKRFGTGFGIAHRMLWNIQPEPGWAAYAHLGAAGGHGAVSPSLTAEIGTRLALPPIYRSVAEVQTMRDRYARGIEELLQQYDLPRLQRCERSLEQLRWTNFLLAYHGRDDRALQVRYGELLDRAVRVFAPQLVHAPPPRSAGTRPRVGLLSSSFRYSTVGSYFGSWPEALEQAGFETFVYQVGPTFDSTTDKIGAGAAHLVKLQDGPVEQMAATVREAQLDLLLFVDPGVDSRIVPLSALRLAQRQAMAWGHPVTFGLRTIDTYFSCALMEPPDAQAHYHERLLLLPGIGTRYARPQTPAVRSRAELGLPDGRLYLVPQSPYKIHPDSDQVFARIAARDPGGRIAFFATERPGTTRALRARLVAALEAEGADPRRQLVFLPLVTRSRFLEICRACDLMIDTLHWSGGNTAIDALISSLPVLACPGEFMRGRQSLGMLSMLGVDGELVCDTPQAQADRAVELAGDPARLRALRERIAQRVDVLFDGREALAALAGHVRELLAEPPRD